MTKVLIDSDVLLDFFFDREPFSEDAAKILSLCESKRMIGYITPVIISNVYYLLRRAAKHEAVIEKLSRLISILEVLKIDKNTIIQALNSEFIDFEDALQNYSAQNDGQINYIVTRNSKDYKHSSLIVQTPSQFLQAGFKNR